LRGCRAQLGELQRHLTRFQAARAAVMTLSIDAPEVAAGTAAKLGLHFPLLSDPHARVIRQYRMFTPPMNMAPMALGLGASLLVERERLDHWETWRQRKRQRILRGPPGVWPALERVRSAA